MMQTLYGYLCQDEVAPCPCHCDSYDPNFLLDRKGKMYLIDWEYAGMSDPGCDFGTFVACSDYSAEEAEHVLAIYLDHEPTSGERRHYLGYVAMTSYFWYLWALYQEKCAKHVGEYLYIWYKYSKQYGRMALQLYENKNGTSNNKKEGKL